MFPWNASFYVQVDSASQPTTANLDIVLGGGGDTHPLWWRWGITFSLLIPHEDHVSPLFLSLERLRQCENIGRKLCYSFPPPLSTPPPHLNPDTTVAFLILLHKMLPPRSRKPCVSYSRFIVTLTSEYGDYVTGWASWIRFPDRTGFLSLPKRPDHFYLYFLGGNVARAWS